MDYRATKAPLDLAVLLNVEFTLDLKRSSFVGTVTKISGRLLAASDMLRSLLGNLFDLH